MHFTLRKDPSPSQSCLGPARQPVRHTRRDRTRRAAAGLPTPALHTHRSHSPSKPAPVGAFPHGSEGRQVPLSGPHGRLIRYTYHTAHSGSDQIKTGDFLFTDFFISASCGQDAMQHTHLSQFAPSHLPSLIFQQSLGGESLIYVALLHTESNRGLSL